QMASTLDQLKPEIEAHIRSVPDFPIKGINFRDIMPLMRQPKLVGRLCQAVADHIQSKGGVQAVAGLEARGFLFGPQIAQLLDVPFVPIRKAGKLPGECVATVYAKEYGEDRIEVQKGAIAVGDRVLIIDDLLATGGTLAAAIDLITKVGGIVVESFVIIELAGLCGRAKLPKDVHTHALLVYPGA
ncbi:hypothetical protein PFISCL1PPCAC_18950, partial [Pristionchus fissidentatus]